MAEYEVCNQVWINARVVASTKASITTLSAHI